MRRFSAVAWISLPPRLCFRPGNKEKSMKTLCRLATGLIALAALIEPAISDPAYRITAPVAQDNLSVYFVRGNGSGGAAPLTLDQAVNNGQAKLQWHQGDPVTVENLSDRSLFVPFGMLLKGGLQDQVTSVSMLVPPHSGPMSLATFCVDPFRSTARDQEDPTKLAPTDAVLPSRVATLAMLADAPNSDAVTHLRQASVWWSIDTTRASLSRRLGVTIEPPYQARWAATDYQDHIANPMLGERSSPWTTSLPLALENAPLRQAEQAYVDALAGKPAKGGDIIGAVFAVNGNIEGAEIYQSHTLFAAMWPKLLRTHAIAALAAGSDDAHAPPAVETVHAFLAAAQAGTARAHASGAALRDSPAAIFAETSGRDGKWVNRSFVATAMTPQTAASPEAVVLGILMAGAVNGQPVKALGDRDLVVLHRGVNGWSATVEPRPDDVIAQLQAALAAGLGTNASASHGMSLMAATISFAFFALMFWLLKPHRAGRRNRIVLARYGTVHAQFAPLHREPAPAVAWRVPGKPLAERLRPVVVTMKAFAARLAAAFERSLVTGKLLATWPARRLARRLAAAWAAWPPEGLVTALARHLGPAWPGNFGPPSRTIRLSSRT
jgi:hypothetical protein